MDLGILAWNYTDTGMNRMVTADGSYTVRY